MADTYNFCPARREKISRRCLETTKVPTNKPPRGPMRRLINGYLGDWLQRAACILVNALFQFATAQHIEQSQLRV